MAGKPTCPICKRVQTATEESWPHRPFCSQRCRTVDLGSWLSGDYRISRPLHDEDLDRDLDEGLDEGLGIRGIDEEKTAKRN